MAHYYIEIMFVVISIIAWAELAQT